jgi:hypothetical protein
MISGTFNIQYSEAFYNFMNTAVQYEFGFIALFIINYFGKLS